MSSLASAPNGAAREPDQDTSSIRLGRLHVSIDAALGVCLALGLAVVAFVTAGGVEQAPNTWTQIVLTVLGAALAIAVLLRGAPGPAWGAVPLALFAALVVLTALSIFWSVQPANSWTETGRTLSYMAIFGGSLALARLYPGRWPALVGAVGAAATVIAGYALLVKVFPATFDPGETFGRLRAPFDYWNATGLIGALGLPVCLWAGARREGGHSLRALSVPAVTILISVIVLSYSRGAVLVAVVGLACWFALVPLRLRGSAVLGLGAVGAAIVAIYAIKTKALTGDLVALHARTTAGHWFGVVLVLVLVPLTVAGFAAVQAMDRVEVGRQARRRLGIATLTVVALVPLGGIVGVAASPRGLTGEVSHVWNQLTSPSLTVSNTPSRFVQLGNSRGRYWSEGLKVGEHALLKGVGALGYGTAVARYTTDPRIVAHAHSYVVETFADFGLIGVVLMVAMLTSWSLAARRTLGAGGSVEHAAERAGLLTMLAVVMIFGIHSAIDWTWFIPGTALPALACAGWIAGRGPVSNPIGVRPLAAGPGRLALALGVVALTLLAAWAMWQPLRSADADGAALTAVSNGNITAAIADARSAVAADPVSADALFELAALYTAAGNRQAAADQLRDATARQPQNPRTWLQLGEFYLQADRPRQALRPLETANMLDLSSEQAKLDLARARAEIASSSGA